MATHSSVLAVRIPGTGEPGELPSLGSHRVGHDWSDLAAGMGWVGGGEGRFRREEMYVYLWLIYGAVWQKPMQHCKETILQLKRK